MLKMMVTVRLAFAEAERDRMVQRRKDGIHSMKIRCREARALLLDGMRIEDIAIKFKVSPDRASRMSQPNGVWGSKKGKTFRSKISMSRLKELLELGLSSKDIAAIFKCCNSTLSRKMVKLKQTGWKSKIDKKDK